MLFNSVEFLAFFAVVYAAYLLLQHRGQNLLLLIASFVFYGWWDWRFLSLIWLSTFVDFVAAQRMEDASSDRARRRWLIVSLVFNLGLLGTFKYAGFFAQSLMDAFAGIGYSLDLRFAQLVLPVGISFYTFQSLSYTVDVYRRQLKASRSLVDFALFVAFFPQLVAGPIERATHLLPQVQKPRAVTYDMLREGAWLVLLGYYKKVVIADNMAPFTTRVFENPADVHGLEVLVAVYAFAFQIYGDFSGYSDIARGTAKFMGFDLMHNFRMPYFAINPSDFWRRWHVSLSSWLRDYLYISLGGNRLGNWHTYRNLMLTMLLGGLWHGAAYNFVAWGIFHGTILCVHRWFAGEHARAEPRVTPLKVFLFFHVTCFGWLLFAVKQLSDVPLLMKNFWSPFEVNGLVGLATIATFTAPVLLLDWLQFRSSNLLLVKTWSKPVRAGVYTAAFAAILLCGATGAKQFIYFQF